MPLLLLFVTFILTHSLVASEICPERNDNLQISHVEVANEQDYYYCFGYLHGRDRAWQMDFFRRSGQGRNAEVLGFAHLKTDLMMRLLGLPELAKKFWNEMPNNEKTWWIKYAEGVNEGMLLGKNAKEFELANYQLEPWKPEDSILILLLQSFDQTRKTFIKDYEEQLALEKYGEKAIELFSLDNLPWDDTILQDGEYPKKKITSFFQHDPAKDFSKIKLWEDFPSLFGLDSGSNNWVVSKNKSKTKNALLANDPHLNLRTPSYWYWLNLKIKDDLNTIGGSLPGVPVIVSGTNNKVAWGLTNAYINTAGAAFIKNMPAKELKTIWPLVWFKFGFLKLPFFFKSFERTINGFPVLPLEIKDKRRLVLRWSGFYLKATDFSVLLKLKSVQNVEDANNVLSKINIPAWNYVFADYKGDIGYRVVGNAFKYTEKPPFGAALSDWSEYIHPLFLDPNERPHLLKPKLRDYIYTANHRHWPSDAAFHGGQAYTLSFRGFRIHELLKNQIHDIESFKNIQCDSQAVDARFFVPLLLNFLKNELKTNQNNLVKKSYELLSAWDYQTNLDCVACGLYRRWIDLLNFEWKTTEQATYRILSKHNNQLQKDILKTLNQALNDTNFKPWGELHLNHFKHLSTQDGQKEKSDWQFAPEISTIGDTFSVNPGTSKWNDERKIYDHYSGASMRMIIEMDKNKAKVFLSLPGKNKNYDQVPNINDHQWQDWASCQYQEVEF